LVALRASCYTIVINGRGISGSTGVDATESLGSVNLYCAVSYYTQIIFTKMRCITMRKDAREDGVSSARFGTRTVCRRPVGRRPAAGRASGGDWTPRNRLPRGARSSNLRAYRNIRCRAERSRALKTEWRQNRELPCSEENERPREPEPCEEGRPREPEPFAEGSEKPRAPVFSVFSCGRSGLL